MPKEYIYTKVEGQSIKLSSLDKIIYPDLTVTKAEIIKYFLANKTYLLEHVVNRPLTIIRYPDGINKEKFYSKDKPDWTPSWIESVKIDHDDATIDYVKVAKAADLAWLANLSALELHPMQSKVNNLQYPDYFIFDLDPDKDVDFDLTKTIAVQLKAHLKNYDYPAFIKTSGGKGLHIFVPIKSKYSFDEMNESVSQITKSFVALNSKICTLQIRKEKRKGKIFIDTLRNHFMNTTVAPFSLRGRKGAPISMPVHWEHIDQIEAANQFNIKNYQTYTDDHGYAWQDWRAYEANLHNAKTMVAFGQSEIDPRLQPYADNRDFTKSPEPAPRISSESKDAYVLQLHDATKFHYDLRLEVDGVLRSWAIPYGLPYSPDQKRLAIRTEDYPVGYLDFEGDIPKGLFGGGSVLQIDHGKVYWIKKEQDELSFSLSGDDHEAVYHLIHEKEDKQWFLHIDEGRPSEASEFIQPMLATADSNVPEKKGLKYEVKWDGIRVVVVVDNKKVKLFSRSGNDITNQFPELQDPANFKIQQGVLDGEIVVLDKSGKPQFYDTLSRLHTKGEKSISALSKRKPSTCYLFDLMRIEGRDVRELTLKKRRQLLKAVLKSNRSIRMSESFDDGVALFNAIQAKGMEGIMAKYQSSKYHEGNRSGDWIKIKCRYRATCVIIGYTQGEGSRSEFFGAFHVGVMEEDSLVYKGKVGTGFDYRKMRELHAHFKDQFVINKPVEAAIEKESETTWIDPVIYCEIEYASMTSNDTYREPVFIRLLGKKQEATSQD